jgi:uncharacterized cofD-like protein
MAQPPRETSARGNGHRPVAVATEAIAPEAAAEVIDHTGDGHTAPPPEGPPRSTTLRIASIGGGSGQANLLRGLKARRPHLSAIVTVADDGGSSGRLRADMGVLPPGDIRRCILALANAEPLVEQLFQHRFDEADGPGFGGHSFGNLFIVAMSRVAGGLVEGIRETGRVLAVEGDIHPATLADVALCARMADGSVIRGESVIPRAATLTAGPIADLWLEPTAPPVNQEAAGAILAADTVVIGPGSLYTSVIPNLLVPGIRDALLTTRARKVFVVNVANQRGETDGFDARDHYRAVTRHLGADVDFVLANSSIIDAEPIGTHTSPVVATEGDDFGAARLVMADLVHHESPHRHDSDRLAQLIMQLSAPSLAANLASAPPQSRSEAS